MYSRWNSQELAGARVPVKPNSTQTTFQPADNSRKHAEFSPDAFGGHVADVVAGWRVDAPG